MLLQFITVRSESALWHEDVRIREGAPVHVVDVRGVRHRSPSLDVAVAERGTGPWNDAQELARDAERESEGFFDYGMLEEAVLVLLEGAGLLQREHNPSTATSPAQPSSTGYRRRLG